MKLKKMLCSILAIAMLLSTMSFTVFADEGTTYEASTLEKLKETLETVADGDTILLTADEYDLSDVGLSVDREITLQGAVDEDGNPTTVFKGGKTGTDRGYYDYTLYMNKGTIKNIKIIDSWKGIMSEGEGNLTIDNVTMVDITYGIHIAEAKNSEDTVTIQNCNLNLAWANSFCGGSYKIILKNNEFTSSDPTGVYPVNTFNPNTTVTDNVFGEATQMLIRDSAKDGVDIGPNYYEDGVENALADGCKDVKIETYYVDREMTQEVETPACGINDAYTSSNRIWGETGCNARNSFEIKVYSDDTLIGTTSLNNINGIIDGNVYVTWGLYTDGTEDEYWTQTWEAGHPRVDCMPTKVVYYVDGVNVGETNVQFNGPDNLWPVEWGNVAGVYSAAKIGDVKYATIQAAVDAAVADENEIVILPGTYDENFKVTQKDGINITIKAENLGDVTLTGTVTIDGNKRGKKSETLDFENLIFDGSSRASDTVYLIQETNGKDAHNVTITNCKFYDNNEIANNVIGYKGGKVGPSGAYNITFESCKSEGLFALAQFNNAGKLTVNNCTVTGKNGVQTRVTPEIIFTNNTFDVDGYAVYAGQKTTGNKVDSAPTITFEGNKVESGSAAISLQNTAAKVEIENNTIDAESGLFSNSNSDDTIFNDVAITDEKVVEKVGETNIVIPAEISVNFEKVEAGLYNIILSADDDIYEFVSAELAFVNNSTTLTGQGMGYEIVPEANIIVNENIANKGTFNFNIKPNADGVSVDRITRSKIVLGKVVFPSNGTYKLSVNTAESKVTATKYNTNDEQDYVADSLVAGTAIDSTGVGVAKRDIAVNVNFVHDITDGAQDFKVTIRNAYGDILPVQTLDIEGNKGITTFTGVEIGNVTVTLEAEGFRKFTYRTTLEKGEGVVVLNFWNDWKRNTTEDPELEIEEGKGKVSKNFIAGDIAMDYIVDKYDLAAVTSYYGTYGYTDANFVKYDLNRDGKIDIDDVAYVLHNFGK